MRKLSTISHWWKGNKLKLNGTDKICGFSIEPVSGTDTSPKLFAGHGQLEHVDCIKYLRATLDLQFRWQFHIANVSSKRLSICFILLRIRTYISGPTSKKIS